MYLFRMPARLPVQAKSPFAIDPKPLDETASSHAGLLATSRVYRSLKLPDLIAANLSVKSRKRGFTEAQFIETILLLQTAGGDCPEDLSLLSEDRCLEKGLGYALPKTNTVRDFLNLFHDEELEKLRPSRLEQKSFILAASSGITSLQQVQQGLVGKVAKLYAEQKMPLRRRSGRRSKSKRTELCGSGRKSNLCPGPRVRRRMPNRCATLGCAYLKRRALCLPMDRTVTITR